MHSLLILVTSKSIHSLNIPFKILIVASPPMHSLNILIYFVASFSAKLGYIMHIVLAKHSHV